MRVKISELGCDYDSRDDLNYTDECTESMTDSKDRIASSLLQEAESSWKGEGGLARLQTDTEHQALSEPKMD